MPAPPMPRPIATALCSLVLAATAAAQAAWPMGAGPDGDWSVALDGDATPPPTRWSGETGEGIAWRTPLPETGQGGIAIAGDRLFVATMAPWTGEGLDAEDAETFAHATEKRTVVGKHIDAHCLERATGRILWTRRIEGEVPSIYSYPFSDATSASPCCDDRHVWFTNAGGRLVCYTHDGDEVWQRRFTPTFDGPFNKQFEPMLVADPARGAGAATLIHMEPYRVGSDDLGGGDAHRWNFLVGLDAATGEQLWTSEHALTHYNAPILVHTDAHGTCVLHARGGPHQVPERPLGMSLTRATGADAGKAVWRYDDARDNHEGALQTMAADERFAYWLLKTPNDVLVAVDLMTGEAATERSLTEAVTVVTGPELARPDGTVDLERGVFPARYSMHAAGGSLWFLTYATAWGKPTLAAGFSLARATVPADGAPSIVYTELPTTFSGHGDDRILKWRERLEARAIGSRDEEVTGDPRSRWDGWDWVFHPSPTRVGTRLYFTMPTGIVYVVDTDAGALVAVCDLGPLGRTWTGNSVSYADGRLYHRTARELLCIGRPHGS